MLLGARASPRTSRRAEGRARSSGPFVGSLPVPGRRAPYRHGPGSPPPRWPARSHRTCPWKEYRSPGARRQPGSLEQRAQGSERGTYSPLLLVRGPTVMSPRTRRCAIFPIDSRPASRSARERNPDFAASPLVLSSRRMSMVLPRSAQRASSAAAVSSLSMDCTHAKRPDAARALLR